MKNIKILFAILTFAILMTVTTFGQESSPTPTPDATPENQVQQPEQSSNSTPVEPKKDGVVRIGIVAPKVQLGQTTGQDVSESVRQLFSSNLNGAAIETISLESKTPAQIGVEAQQKGCDFVLYTAISQKQKTSLFGNLIKVTVPVLASSVPGGNVASTGIQQGGISGVAQQSVQAMVKAKDVITLEFGLVSVSDPSVGVKKALKAKADSDGQDVLTPLVEQASAAIAEAIIKK